MKTESLSDRIRKALQEKKEDDIVTGGVPGWENEYVKHAGYQKIDTGENVYEFHSWNLKRPVAGKPANDTVTTDTLLELGIPVPPKPDSD